jgi:predicted metalloendopeptidase
MPTISRALLNLNQACAGKLGKPIDRNEWGMTPQTVNAYYNPTMNENGFPGWDTATAAVPCEC